MNAFNNLFNRHCQNTLLARGWPADMELNYSLAYCQGDGVAFYGVLHDKEILSLLAGLVKYNHITAKLAEEVADHIGAEPSGWCRAGGCGRDLFRLDCSTAYYTVLGNGDW